MESYIESVKEQAHDINQHALSVLKNEKKIRGYTNKHIANISGISEEVVKYLFADKPPKDPRAFPMIRIAMSLELDLNYVFGYNPPSKTDTSVVTIKDDNYISEIVKAHERHIEDIKAMCELRIADIRQMYEERLAEQRDFNKEVSPYMILK